MSNNNMHNRATLNGYGNCYKNINSPSGLDPHGFFKRGVVNQLKAYARTFYSWIQGDYKLYTERKLCQYKVEWYFSKVKEKALPEPTSFDDTQFLKNFHTIVEKFKDNENTILKFTDRQLGELVRIYGDKTDHLIYFLRKYEDIKKSLEGTKGYLPSVPHSVIKEILDRRAKEDNLNDENEGFYFEEITTAIRSSNSLPNRILGGFIPSYVFEVGMALIEELFILVNLSWLGPLSFSSPVGIFSMAIACVAMCILSPLIGGGIKNVATKWNDLSTNVFSDFKEGVANAWKDACENESTFNPVLQGIWEGLYVAISWTALYRLGFKVHRYFYATMYMGLQLSSDLHNFELSFKFLKQLFINQFLAGGFGFARGMLKEAMYPHALPAGFVLPGGFISALHDMHITLASWVGKEVLQSLGEKAYYKTIGNKDSNWFKKLALVSGSFSGLFLIYKYFSKELAVNIIKLTLASLVNIKMLFNWPVVTVITIGALVLYLLEFHNKEKTNQ